MRVKKIASEVPEHDQWRLLLQYGYHRNITRYLEEQGITNPAESTVEFISGSILQGESYFQAARAATLHIRPLLLYYGVSNLLAGAGALLTGTILDIHTHGMNLIIPEDNQDELRVAQMAVRPIDPEGGALHKFCSVFSHESLRNSSQWSVKEIFGSIPDLVVDYTNCYQDALPFVIPTEVVQTRNGTIERISPESIQRFESVEDALQGVDGLLQSYLRPQHSDQMDYIVLRPKRTRFNDIGVYSIKGRKFLQIGHMKNGTYLNPGLLIIKFMGLYALGVLSRYHPQIWNPFVRNDLTGERLVVERFLDICERYVPNLVLNAITGDRILFVSDPEGHVDLSAILTESDLNHLVEQKVREVLAQKGNELR